MPTEMELTLEQTQQGVSYEVSVFKITFSHSRQAMEQAQELKSMITTSIHKAKRPMESPQSPSMAGHRLLSSFTLVELDSHLRIEESLRVQDIDKLKSNNVAGPSVVNMVEHNNSSRYNDNKGKCKHHDNTKADPNKKAKPTCWKCGKTGHIKRDCKGVNVGNKANGSGTKGSVDGSSNLLKGQNMFNKSLQVYYVTYVSEAYFVHDDDVAWWVDSGEIVHVCKDRCWFKTYESLNDGSIPHMGNESTALVHGCGCVDLKFSFGKIILLGHVHFKMMQDMSKDGLILAFDMHTKKYKICMMTKITKKPFQNVKRKTEVLELFYSDLCDLHATPSLRNKKYFVTFIDNALRFCYVYLLHLKDEALDKFKVFKTEVELQQGFVIKRFRTNKGDMLSLMRIDSLQSIDQVSGFQMELQTLGLVVPEEVTKEVVQQPEPELRKIKKNRTPKNFGLEFQLYLIEGTMDEVSDQHSYCFNVKGDPKTFDEAINSQDVAF
ncbi:zinc finger, CCHC-type containing protein [Tanacetum coccineum]